VKKCTKMSTPFQMNFSAQKYASHATAVVIDDVIIIGRRRVDCASTLLGRCLCKRVDMYIITLSCTWRIYAFSECLLVLYVLPSGVINDDDDNDKRNAFNQQ